MKKSHRSVLAAVAALLVGCGTLQDMHLGDGGRRVFGGIRYDLTCFTGNEWGLPCGVYAFVAPLDLPFSFVSDVLVLPLTLSLAAFANE